MSELNAFIIRDCDTPVLNIRNTPYNNAILLRNIPLHVDRLEILLELKRILKLDGQLNNLTGYFFVNETNNSTDHLSVVLLLRSIKKFKKSLNIITSHLRNFCSVLLFNYWVEVYDIKEAGYSISYIFNDGLLGNSLSDNNMLVFDNEKNLDVFAISKMFDCLVNDKDLIGVSVSKKKIFLTLTSYEFEDELLKVLLLNFGTDFDLRKCHEKIILVKKNGNIGNNNIRVSINL